MRKKLRLDKQVIRRLSDVALAAPRGGMDNDPDDGTTSTFPVCPTFYCPTKYVGCTDWCTWRRRC